MEKNSFLFKPLFLLPYGLAKAIKKLSHYVCVLVIGLPAQKNSLMIV